MEALGIDASFLDKFTPLQWANALKEILTLKPEDVPTEVFLKQQHLWFMHKLLMHVPGVKERIAQLIQMLKKPNPEESTLRELREKLSINMSVISKMLLEGQTPVSTLLNQLDMLKSNFVDENNGILEREVLLYRYHVEMRRQVIRWFALMYVGPPGFTGHLAFLQQSPIEVLLQTFLEWNPQEQ